MLRAFSRLARAACSWAAIALFATGWARAQGTLRALDVEDVASAARVRIAVLRETLRAAERRDAGALDSLLALAADSTTRSTHAYPAVAWALLIRFGDSLFAGAVRRTPPALRGHILDAVDRGAGVAYSRLFPSTWALGPHAAALLPDTIRPPADSTRIVSSERIYDSGELNRQPGVEPGSCTPLAYPADLLHAGVSGRVVLELVVDSAGELLVPLTVVSTTHRDMVGAAERTLQSCRFSPGRRAGRGVRSRSWVPLSFTPDMVDVAGDLVYEVQLAKSVASRGMDFSYEVNQASTGDTAALRALLELAPGIDAATVGYYKAVLEALLRSVGDARFALVLARLPERARVAAVDMARNAAWPPRPFAQRFPRTEALSPRAPGPAGTADTVPEGASRSHMLTALGPDSGRTVDVPPDVVEGSCSVLRYPSDLMNSRLSGRVMLEFIIDTTGRAEPESIRAVLQNHPAFVEFAKAEVRSCRYRPGRIGNRPVRVRVQQPIVFESRP